MAALRIDFVAALRDFELSVDLGVGSETLALVGPSGAGKSTVLRAIAGLLRPVRGRIAMAGTAWFDGAARVNLAPERRSVGYVFQDYALFPHLTVGENVAFGGGDAAAARSMLDRFGIAHLAGERPGAISGGERQRVALARALARRPSVLLLDEPLSALDTRTRSQVRGELQTLLPELGLPTILVTHDFNDAAALGDRVGVLQQGTLRQVGTPHELLSAPADAFVASFTGANLIAGVAEPADGRSRIRLDGGGSVEVPGHHCGRVELAVHPWELALADGVENANRYESAQVSAVVTGIQPHAGGLRVRCGEIVADVDANAAVVRGQQVCLRFDPARARVIPAA